jgi:UDP-N-acetylmuramoylalanine--D-glutamate ligase
MLVCLPVTGDRLATLAYSAAPEVDVLEAASLDAAMQALAARRDKFDTVILSPGAPSYGQLETAGKVFRNFEERGEAFVRLAKTYFAAS